MTKIEAIGIPDSKPCKEVIELVRDTEPDLLFNHSSRVYYFGALTGRRRSWTTYSFASSAETSVASKPSPWFGQNLIG